jgi:hypothetical protein
LAILKSSPSLNAKKLAAIKNIMAKERNERLIFFFDIIYLFFLFITKN